MFVTAARKIEAVAVRRREVYLRFLICCASRLRRSHGEDFEFILGDFEISDCRLELRHHGPNGLRVLLRKLSVLQEVQRGTQNLNSVDDWLVRHGDSPLEKTRAHFRGFLESTLVNVPCHQRASFAMSFIRGRGGARKRMRGGRQCRWLRRVEAPPSSSRSGRLESFAT